MTAMPFDTAVDVYYGAIQLEAVYLGAQKVWPTGTPRIVTSITNTARQLTLDITILNRIRDTATVDWGDGTTTVINSLPGGRATATHTYATAGEKVITVSARNAVDHVDRYTLLTPHALILRPTATGLVMDLGVSLTTQVPVTINWGDGTPDTPVTWASGTATTAQVQHTYARGGTYTITGTETGGSTTVTASLVIPPIVVPLLPLVELIAYWVGDPATTPHYPAVDPAPWHLTISATQVIKFPYGKQFEGDYPFSVAAMWIQNAAGQKVGVIGDSLDAAHPKEWQARYGADWVGGLDIHPGDTLSIMVGYYSSNAEIGTITVVR